MKKINYFSNREECKKFLKQFNFKYFVPYVKEEDLQKESKRYYIQLNEECTKIRYCSIQKLGQGLIYNNQPFYDSDYAYIEKNGIKQRRYKLEDEGEVWINELKENGINYYV